MSIVCWDGKLLACDRMGVNNGMQTEERKCREYNNVVVAWTGSIAEGREMANWFGDGEKAADFPECQKDRERWARLIVASSATIYYYEQTACRLEVIGPFMAWGAGRDFAMGAFYMGASAIEAAEAACQFSDSCGKGLDVFDLSNLR